MQRVIRIRPGNNAHLADNLFLIPDSAVRKHDILNKTPGSTVSPVHRNRIILPVSDKQIRIHALKRHVFRLHAPPENNIARANGTTVRGFHGNNVVPVARVKHENIIPVPRLNQITAFARIKHFIAGKMRRRPVSSHFIVAVSAPSDSQTTVNFALIPPGAVRKLNTLDKTVFILFGFIFGG